MRKSIVFLVVCILFAKGFVACGGGGGSNSGGGGDTAETLNLNISANPSVDSTSSYTLHKTTLYLDYNTINSNSAYFKLAIAYTDINKDGHLDVFLSTGDASENRTPVQVSLNNGSDIFSDQTSSMITNAEPGSVHPRKALNGDYNGDGWPDVLIIGHGYDKPPFPGEYPLLFLSNGNGTLRYAGGLESLAGFHHGGASADIDADGDIDIFVADNKAPFFLINDGYGNFTNDTSRLTTELNGKPLFTAELIDIDKDGYVDLIVGGGEDYLPTAIYWGSSSGTYKASNKTVLPAATNWPDPLDFAAEDLDGDGMNDLIINRTNNAYIGRYIQVLRQTAIHQFSDETTSRITMDTTLTWFPWLRVQDVDGDGHSDLFIDDKSFCSAECAWQNNGSGIFTSYTGTITPSL